MYSAYQETRPMPCVTRHHNMQLGRQLFLSSSLIHLLFCVTKTYCDLLTLLTAVPIFSSYVSGHFSCYVEFDIRLTCSRTIVSLLIAEGPQWRTAWYIYDGPDRNMRDNKVPRTVGYLWKEGEGGKRGSLGIKIGRNTSTRLHKKT